MAIEDEILFGWDPSPGIVSIWADHEGTALVFRRSPEAGVLERTLERERFEPWILAASLTDLAHLGDGLVDATRSPTGGTVRYRELEGEPGSFRYLLTARSGRVLARTILTGAWAGKRSEARPFDELEGYWRVGPVEQYLMSTGRAYYRGLAYDDLRRMQIDLETTSLDPETGRIFLVAVRDSLGFATTIEAAHEDDEARLIAELCEIVRTRDPDVIENHNLFGFDLPFLERRADAVGVALMLGRAGAPPRLSRVPGGRSKTKHRYTIAGRELIDTLEAVRRHDFVARDLPSHGLKDVARHFGVARPDRVYLPGATIHQTFERDPDLVRRYALDDVAEVDGLSRRLLQAPFALAAMAPRRFERLASAGPATGVLEPILLRAYLRKGAAPPALERQSDTEELGAHAGGALYLFATGVAEHVVKADIASLYPSLMVRYAIGPERDRLGALLHVVTRLLELRLAHKAAAREAAPGSPEHGHHMAIQAAMKLLINSAYGYMGAGSIALFADRRAADEVTRRGRAILDHLVRALRARGVALIEADTDGVYFAVDPRSTEAEERTIVASVGAELPEGIRLEYEGRYRAMFSHEVKNYALLTYEGEVILRGVALRSSRSEPFGERFLREALKRTMMGDVAGLATVFRETAAALRSRALPVEAIATRTRVTKSPEEYLASRSSHREPAYEALLGSGKRTWARGDRVRYYRARGGAYALLTEDDDPSHVHEEEDDAPSAPDASRPQASHAQPSRAPRPDYDADHYVSLLLTSYAARLRKAFDPEDFERVFRLRGQLGLFDRPVTAIEPRWIRVTTR